MLSRPPVTRLAAHGVCAGLTHATVGPCQHRAEVQQRAGRQLTNGASWPLPSIGAAGWRVRPLMPPCMAWSILSEGVWAPAQALLPVLKHDDVVRGSDTYRTGRVGQEGLGTMCGRTVLIKTAQLSEDPALAERYMTEIQAYERLAPLQGQCVAVLEAGGKSSEDELVLAVSGGIRLHKEYGSSTNAVYLEDVSPEARWAALDGLRQINDAGMLHGCAHTGSLLVQPSQDGTVTAQPLWADFGASRILPGLTRSAPAALDEAFTAALALGAPEWNASLLQADAALLAAGRAVSDLPIVALLPAHGDEDVQLDRIIGSSQLGGVVQGAVHGRPAVIKLAPIADDVSLLPEVLAEVRAYRRLEALQGSCIPVLIGAGTIEGGRTAFIAMSDAGIQLTTLEQQCDPLLQTEALTPEEHTAALEALSLIHDRGVLHGDPQAHNLMVQRREDGYAANRVLWIDFGHSSLVPGMSSTSAMAAQERMYAGDALQEGTWELEARRRAILAGGRSS